ncbi:site-specific recombinase XerD [Pedobacter sp. CG_S7]|uniref:site-specific integrase n=1 Tax=Pedobacter sp. CG_S7 TaxID=3143930 RepID=UPI003393E4B0
MKTNFSLLFYLKRPKNYQKGPIPVYMRITVDGKRSEVATSRECEPTEWSVGAGRAKGTREKVRSFNAYLDNLQTKVYDACEFLDNADADITAESIKEVFMGKVEKPLMLLEIFAEHNRKVAALVGAEYAAGTLQRYETSLKHTKDFLEWKYKKPDMDIKRIDHDFVTNYEFYLRTERKCANNSAVKYIKNFKKIIRICLASGWITKDPFVNYKAKVKQVDRVFLNQEELQSITDKVFATNRIGQVRDIFLFSCYTGLAYADVKKLKRTEIVKGVDDGMWIFTKRQKTSTPTRVPLLPAALSLLNKYKDHPVCSNNDTAFPVSSNQKMNAYLKEIADICSINKDLTFHIARHTFATTVTLLNGVPIESVSKMLGHTNIKTTQHYAKILDIKVGADMALLRQKFAIE